MRRGTLLLTLLIAGLVARPAPVRAAGLAIEPGGLLLQDVPVGQARSVEQASGIRFVVSNRDDVEHEYTIYCARPSQTGNGRWPRGYAEIPDPRWVRPDQGSLVVPPGGERSFDVIIEIPEAEEHYNQKWAVTVAVEGEPAPGSNVALALYPMIQIETPAKRCDAARPLGSVAVAPAVLNATPEGEPVEFEIYNNDAAAHDYWIRIDSPGGKAPATPGLSPSAPERLAVRAPQKVRVPAWGSAKVEIEFHPAAAITGAWEQLVFVESDAGDCTFVRLQAGRE